MALTVTEVAGLRAYVTGVMERADHHAGNVKEIVLTLTGAILWRKDDEEPIRVMAREGVAKNVLWVSISRQRYAFVYNHDTGEIDMRRDGIQGPVEFSFSNATPLATLQQLFQNL